jgi:hypothetical protein
MNELAIHKDSDGTYFVEDSGTIISHGLTEDQAESLLNDLLELS